MGRLFIFLIIALIAGAIALIKNSVGMVSRNEKLKKSSVQSEVKNVMDKTAKGISWMDKQWEESKKSAGDSEETDEK